MPPSDIHIRLPGQLEIYGVVTGLIRRYVN